MLSAEFVTDQLNSGLPVDFATTDQTIEAAQQDQQQLLAQTTVIDEQFVMHNMLVEETEMITEHGETNEVVHSELIIEEPIVVSNQVRIWNAKELTLFEC